MKKSERKPVVQTQLAIEITKPVDVVIPAEEVNHGVLYLPSQLPGFIQEKMPEDSEKEIRFDTNSSTDIRVCAVRTFYGSFHHKAEDSQLYCPLCRRRLAGNGTITSTLSHLPEGGIYTRIIISRKRYRCTNKECGYSYIFPISFQAKNHMITQPLLEYITNLLSHGISTRDIAYLTGISRNTVHIIHEEMCP